MKSLTRTLLVVAICSVAISLSAAIRPHFLVTDSAWRATEIVEVEETKATEPGTFDVVEVWKGTLLPGQTVRIPGMAEWQEPSRKIAVSDESSHSSTPLRTNRLVLFLTRKVQGESGSAHSTWIPATLWNTWQTSFAWIEGEKAFAYEQGVFVNGQPATLHELPENEVSFQESVLKFATERDDFNRAVTMNDRGQRAEEISQFFRSENPSAQVEAFEEIEKLGREALPALRTALHDPRMLPRDAEILQAMATVGGVEAGPDLAGYLESDVAYWTELQPHLDPVWWDHDLQNMRALENQRDHYADDLRALEGLIAMDFTPARSTIARFCNRWSKVPPTGVNSAGDQIGDRCQAASKQFALDGQEMEHDK
jgi:hypothetical protein